MINNVSFFAVHTNDTTRARKFYEAVFGWRFEAWGPPGFWLIKTGPDGDGSIQGAMHTRHEPLTGTGLNGFECTIAVASIDETQAKVEANGGTIVMPKSEIPTVGTLIYFHDPEGNRVGAMQYV